MTKSELANLLNIDEYDISYNNDRWDINLYDNGQLDVLFIENEFIENNNLKFKMGRFIGHLCLVNISLSSFHNLPTYIYGSLNFININELNLINLNTTINDKLYLENISNLSIPNKISSKCIYIRNSNIKFLNRHNNYNLYETNNIKFIKYPYD